MFSLKKRWFVSHFARYIGQHIRQHIAGMLMVVLTIGAQAATPAATFGGQSAQGVLWEVRAADTRLPVAYLFGSIHLAKASFYPLPEIVQQAFEQSEVLMVEIDGSDAQAGKKAMPWLSYAMPDNLKKHIRPATWKKLHAMLGGSVTQVSQLKPAIVATSLSLGIFTAQGYDAAEGIDLHFIRRAHAAQKPVIELESMEFQAQVLGGLDDEDGDALLQQTMDALQSGEAVRETEQMVRAWQDGDAETLVRILEQTANKDQGSRRMMKLLLDDRNPRMAEQMATAIQAGKKIFVTVGAGHIAGHNSITDLLQHQGYQLRQLRPSDSLQQRQP